MCLPRVRVTNDKCISADDNFMTSLAMRWMNLVNLVIHLYASAACDVGGMSFHLDVKDDACDILSQGLLATCKPF